MKRRANQGMAVVSALGFLVIVVIFVGVAMMMGVANRRQSADSYQTTRAQYAAEAGIERGFYEAYTKVLDTSYQTAVNAGNGASWKPDVASYKIALNNYNMVGTQKLTSGQTLVLNPGALPDGESYTVTVARQDTDSTVKLTVTATGSYGSAQRRISQEFNIRGGTFPGGAYAILSNNVNCIFCHTTVTSIEAAYSATSTTTPLNMGSLAGLKEAHGTSRVKVATLQSLTVDRQVDSIVTGTVYTRGATNFLNGQKKNGSSSNTDDQLRTLTFQTASQQQHLLNVANTSTATTARQSMTAPTLTNCSVTSNCTAYKNFYTNYPQADASDGKLPDKFPLPVKDANNDKQISDSEWKDAIANDPNAGSISGGTKKFFATNADGTFGGGTTLTNAAATLSSTSSTNVRGIPGNLVLSDNFEMNGNIYVDGDVVISGTVRGNGKIVARGNVYVVGDVKYNCASDTSSYVACNYNDPSTLPTFAVSAVGNIMMGSYMVTTTGDKGWESTYENKSYTAGNYAADFFDNALTNSTSESPEYIDAGAALPYYDPRIKDAKPYYDSGKAITHANNAAALTEMRALYGLSATQNPTSAQITSYTNTYNASALTALRTYYGLSATTNPSDTQKQGYGAQSLSNKSARPSMLTHFAVTDTAQLTDAQIKSYARATKVSTTQNRTRGSFTMVEIANFNQREYCKAVNNGSGCSALGLTSTYQSGYKPRYYRLRGDGTTKVYRCTTTECRGYGSGGSGSEDFVELTTAELSGAVISDSSPKNNWIAKAYNQDVTDYRDSERKLKELWVNNIECGSCRTGPLQIDGTLYSANAIFGIAGKRSKIGGSITINGSLISADLGMLTTGTGETNWDGTQKYILDNTSADAQKGLRVHYDQRLSGMLGFDDADGLTFTRSNYIQLKVQ